MKKFAVFAYHAERKDMRIESVECDSAATAISHVDGWLGQFGYSAIYCYELEHLKGLIESCEQFCLKQ